MATSPIVTTSATTAMGQLIMVAEGLQKAEIQYNTDNANTPLFTAFNNVNVTPDLDALTITVTATLPIMASVSADGVTLVATDYLA